MAGDPSRRGALAGLATAALVAHARPAAANPTRIRMVTEYPATAMPGENIAAFARELNASSDGTVAVEPAFDAKAPFRSAELLRSIEDGRVEAGDAFGGALAAIDPLFALSSLPFVTRSLAEARRLADLAEPAYRRSFSDRGQILLYTTPWPPTGLWTKADLSSLEAFRALSVRAYDATSASVLTRAGARATNLSFADAMPKLRDGSVDSVLSSGDGGAGRNLWDLLPHFAEIAYAIPMSFAVVDARVHSGLPPDIRRTVDASAARIAARGWDALRTRLDENYARMRANGVTIRTAIDPALAATLRESGRAAVAEWRATARPDAVAILDAFEKA